MTTFSFLNVCMLLLFVLRRHTVCSTNAITCDAGTYFLGEPASVSCNLHEDMKECKLNFIIERFRPNDVTADPGKELVACHWEETTNNHTCNVENGYSFNDDNGDHPILEIPSVDNNSAGFYMCYVMPPNKTQTHVCKLTPIARPVHPITLSTVTPISTTTTGGETSSTIPILIVVVVFAVIIIVVLVVFIVCGRRIKRYVCKHRQQNHDVVLSSRQPSVLLNPTIVERITQRAAAHTDTRDQDVESASRQPLIPLNPTQDECIEQRAAAHTDTSNQDIPSNPTPVECITPRAAAHTDTRIDAHLKDFRLDAREYERMMSLLQREMKYRQTQMSSTLVRSLQNERETGSCLVVVLGSTTLKIVLFNMQGENVDCSQAQKYTIPTEVRQVTGEQLLKFIAKSINDFVDTHNLSGRRMPLGCVVSFPCEHAQDNGHHLTKVKLTKWTKGFGCKDLVGRNIDEILQEALRNNVNCDLEIKAIINDAVDMLVATAHQDANSKISLVLGDGFNACFVQDENKVYTTTECGSFGEGGCLDLYRTDFDRDLDNKSMNIGEQIMEKMVSMAYLGELVRLVLVKLTQEGLLFKNVARESALYKADSFKTSFMPLVERDPEGNFENTEFVLRSLLEVESFTDEDCAAVHYVCRIITERAAHLAATVVAALVKHVEQPEITIAIDKSLYKAHTRFHQLLSDKTIELVGEGFQVNIKPFPNESGRGAALLAAVAT